VEPSVFNCTFNIQSVFATTRDAANEWPISICNIVFSSNGGLRGTGLVWTPGPVHQVIPGPMYLVINNTGTFNDWGFVNNGGGAVNLDAVVTDTSEWTTLVTEFSGLSFA
jgi:hypothetical protein